MENKIEKPKRVEPYTPGWEKKANSIARDFCPPIFACADCGNPFINGYCCSFCGTYNPEGIK